MRPILFLSLFLAALQAGAQTAPVGVYPVLANAHFVTEEGNTDANRLVKNEAAFYRITLLNMNGESVKAGTCYLTVDLGSKLALHQKQGRPQLPLSDYIGWSVFQDEEGFTRLTGKLKVDLPADFTETFSFRLECVGTGTATINAQCVMPREHIKMNASTTAEFTVNKKKKD